MWEGVILIALRYDTIPGSGVSSGILHHPFFMHLFGYFSLFVSFVFQPIKAVDSKLPNSSLLQLNLSVLFVKISLPTQSDIYLILPRPLFFSSSALKTGK